MKHVVAAYNSDIDPRDDPFHPFTPDEWYQQTLTMLRTYLIQNFANANGPDPVPSMPISSSRPTGYSPTAIELMGFKKGIKREIAAYSSLDDHRQGLYHRTNQMKQMCELITNMKHMLAAFNSDIDPRDDPFHPSTPDEWFQQISTMLRTYLIQNTPNSYGPEPVTSGSISSSRLTGYSPAAIELMVVKTGIKREKAAYP